MLIGARIFFWQLYHSFKATLDEPAFLGENEMFKATSDWGELN